jgi:hypothetical protein
LVVHQAMVGNGEHPPPKRSLITAETWKVTGNAMENLAQHVLGIGHTLGTHIPENGRRKRPVDVGGIMTVDDVGDIVGRPSGRGDAARSASHGQGDDRRG